jgi:hypothetical protein
MDTNTHASSSFRSDETGTAMLEFVLIAPILCYLITGILFFRHHIDYAQDSVWRFRNRTWTPALPTQCRSVNEIDSDQNGFGTVLGVRQSVSVAGLVGGFQILAWERYFTNTTQTPYGRLQLNHKNYIRPTDGQMQGAIAPMPDDPWGKQLGSLGMYFGTKFGGGTYEAPEGLAVGWAERFPLIVDPWQRDYSNALEIQSNPLSYSAMMAMRVATIFRADVHKVDLTNDGETKKNPITQAGGGQARSITQ